MYFIGGIKKIIGYDSVLLKKNCDPRNLHCMKLLAASAARIWHARHPFNLLPVKISKGCCHFVPNCYIHDIYMYHKNHSNIPLCSSSSQSSISYFSCTVLKSIKYRVTLFSKIKFQSVWVLRCDWWAFCLFKVSVMRRVVSKLPRTLHYTCNKWHIQCRYMSY